MLGFFKRIVSNRPTAEAMAAAANFVQQEIKSQKVVVFSKSYCPHCKRAKSCLNAELGQGNYKVIELEDRPDMNAIQDSLLQITGARSVPRVFISGKCIGGGSETQQLKDSGELRKLLQQAGALPIAA